MSDYLFENQSPAAGDRFAALASLFDPVTIRHLEGLGVTEGWRCLDVGAGGGSIAGWLAERVGATGRVVATDLDVRWLTQQLRVRNVEVRPHDIIKDTLPERTFDLVHERLVLIHLPERVTALDHMVAALRPGGWLLAEDFDSVIGSDAFVDPRSDDEELGNRILRSVRTLLAQRGADTALGHKLPPGATPNPRLPRRIRQLPTSRWTLSGPHVSGALVQRPVRRSSPNKLMARPAEVIGVRGPPRLRLMTLRRAM